MAKRVNTEPGRTFQEFSLLPGYTKKNCVIPNISLATWLAPNLALKIPLLSAAMTSVTSYEMALALGKEGGLGILPARMQVDEQAEMVRRIKNYEMGFVEEPMAIRENATVEEALRLIEQHGHSKIPVTDKNNKFLGMFVQQHYWQTNASQKDPVTAAMIPFGEVPYCNTPNITVDEAKKLLETNNKNYLVVLDDQNRLVKLAFKKDVEKIKVGAAISTHEGWEKRVQANLAAGVDLIVIDTSDAYNEYASDVIKTCKSAGMNVPLCAGNIVTYDGAMFLMEAGADIVKVGMSSGSICITKREKAVGRAPMTALMEACRARASFYQMKGKYIPVIMDGGIATSADMIIALTFADAVMMGGYFNKFYEASGEKLDENGKMTTDENRMRWVATWGEGSARAQNLDRYGHSSRKTFFAEGEEGIVPYQGRLKPNLKRDLMKIGAALSNSGCMNLEEFRNSAIIELNSPHANEIITSTHNMTKVTK